MGLFLLHYTNHSFLIEKRYLAETEAVYHFELFSSFLIFATESNKIKILNLKTDKVKQLTLFHQKRGSEISFKIFGNSICYVDQHEELKRYSFRTMSLKSSFLLNLDREKDPNNIEIGFKDRIQDFHYANNLHVMFVLTIDGYLCMFFEGGRTKKVFNIGKKHANSGKHFIFQKIMKI